jgi:hypothetical protein
MKENQLRILLNGVQIGFCLRKKMTKKELHQLINESIQLITEKKLCPKGKAYYNRRIKAGEKPSAYLSGRAVKICKGLMEGDEEMVHCENCGWEWKLADGGNDPFTCHKCGHNNIENYDINESLHDWFKKEDWVRIDTQGNITGPCGTMKKGKATTRCLPRAKANSLTKAERAATARKKANADRKGDRVVPNTDKAKVRLEIITPLMKEDINLQTIKNEDKGIQKAAGELNLPYDTIYTSFIKGKEVTLNDDMWSRLENTNSYNINSEGEAIELTRQYNENYQNVSFTEKPQHALILQYSPNKFYLIGGDASLIFARAKGINPQVILATIEPTAKWAYQNVTGGIDEDCGCNDDDIDDYDVESEDDYEGFIMFMKEYARQLNESKLTEAEYHGRKVQLGKIMQGDIKKFKVYVKNNKGKVVKVNFGFGGKSAKGKRMVIKAKNPKRRAAYRARHNCSNPGPRWKANYWSCKKW